MLITGFGSFMNVSDNPSGRIARALSTHFADRHEVSLLELPVSYSEVQKLLSGALHVSQWDVVVLLGVAGRSRKIRMERVARNQVDQTLKGSDGKLSAHSVIMEGSPDRLTTNVPIDALLPPQDALRNSFRISTDAGQYLCNYAYYLALQASLAENSECWTIFIHIPPDEKTFAEGNRSGSMWNSADLQAQVELMVERILALKPKSTSA
ncbi:MAG: hypothetical protein ABJA67_11130 [Chthonomonadales bacterium]